MMKLIILLLLLLAHGAGARVAGFERYEVILSRRPFGEAPPEPEVTAPAVQIPTGPSFADSLRMVALTESQGDIRVGFVDTKVSPPKTYFLFVGDLQDGIEVVSASYEDEQVVLRKDDDERVLSMAHGGRVVTASGLGGRAMGSLPVVSRDVRPGTTGRRVQRVLSPGRQARLEEEHRRAELIPEIHGAVLERHLQEVNMQAIRSGAPPLPIPLTQEQDAQLVEEGVLPPQE